MNPTRFESLTGDAVQVLVKDKELYQKYIDWISAIYDLICRFSLSAQPLTHEVTEENALLEILAKTKKNILSITDLEQGKNEALKGIFEKIQSHVEYYSKNLIPTMLNDLNATVSNGKQLEADAYATEFVDSLLGAYNEIRLLRKRLSQRAVK